MLLLERKWRQIKAWVVLLTLLGPYISPVLGEWVSILDSATVLPVDLAISSTAKEHLISKTFKAVVYTNGSIGAYGDYS